MAGRRMSKYALLLLALAFAVTVGAITVVMLRKSIEHERRSDLSVGAGFSRHTAG